MISVSLRGADTTAQRLQGLSREVHQRLAAATITGTQLVAEDVRQRFFPANQQSAQDSPSPGKISSPGNVYSSSYSADGLTGYVTLEPHVAKVTKALVDVLTRVGQAGRIQHTGIWLNLSAFSRGARGRFTGRAESKGYKSRDGLTFLSFDRHSSGRERLQDWAERSDRGYQIQAKSVPIGGLALQILSVGAALERNRADILSLYQAAVKEGLSVG